MAKHIKLKNKKQPKRIVNRRQTSTPAKLVTRDVARDRFYQRLTIAGGACPLLAVVASSLKCFCWWSTVTHCKKDFRNKSQG